MASLSMDAFREQGFAIVADLFDEADLEPMRAEYAEIIDRRVTQLVAAGELADPHRDESFERRLALLARERIDLMLGLDIMQARGQATFELLSHPKILDLAEQVVGGEIVCSPIQHVRATLPHEQSGWLPTPWHQDAATCWPEADGYLMLSIWIPMVDATLDNGCLELMPGSHKLPLLRHSVTPFGPEIAPDEMPTIEPVPVPVAVGDCVVFQNHTIHRSRPNRTDQVRWSLDLRYQDAYQPTGRPFYPSMLVRSRLRPDRVDVDYKTWCERWEFALAATADVDHYFRWTPPS